VRQRQRPWKQTKIEVAPWVKEMLAAGHETFYRSDQWTVGLLRSDAQTYATEPVDQREISLHILKIAGRVVRENKSRA